MCRERWAALALGSWLLAQPARGDTIDFEATTLLAGRADPRDGQLHTVVPMLEQVSGRASAIKNPWLCDLEVVLQMWGEIDPGDPRDDRFSSGDVDLGYAAATLARGRVALRAGRQLVQGGAARMLQLDGANVQVRVRRLGLQGFAGVPVTPRFGVDRGDAAAGARASYRASFESELGVSFIQVSDDGRLARQDLAVDGRWAPHSSLLMSGLVLWSLAEERLAELDTRFSLIPSSKLELSVDVRRTAPDLFLPLNSIFAVFAEERRDEVGSTLVLSPSPALRLQADYHALGQDGGTGHRAGGKLTLMPGRARRGSVGVQSRVLRLPDHDGYTELRLFGALPLGATGFLTGDVAGYLLEAPINGQDGSLSGQLSAGRGFGRWRGVISGLAAVTPFAERHFEVMARLVYGFSTRIREDRP